ncbi:hypothetical protein [Sanguibacter suaedae]|uniref:Uncharacterized protein n=1 Tax=Sanguibacter suaedae TaxID=2795737 RepID=A0A934I8L1_9MICO|nr:hypothetical protein [Sanguibacter suaedae]MBI9115127.1 hypothetical protein [Sanguibacter suaedae]
MAGTVRLAECAAKEGVEFTVVGSRFDPVYTSETEFGPWTGAQAETFGFVGPMTDRDMQANGVVREDAETSAAPPREPVNEHLTDEDWAVIDECAESAEVKAVDALYGSGGPWEEQLAAVETTFLEHPDVQSAVDELGTCFESEGLTPDPELIGFPEGADTALISEEQVRMALTTVACKDKTGFTEKVAQVKADLQAPVIVTYLDELLAQRKAIDDGLAEARSLAAEVGRDDS